MNEKECPNKKYLFIYNFFLRFWPVKKYNYNISLVLKGLVTAFLNHKSRRNFILGSQQIIVSLYFKH